MSNALPSKQLTTSVPKNETERLAALHRYKILDTPPEAAFDRITRLAAQMFNMPTVLISFVDETRAWFKSCIGFDAREVQSDATLYNFATSIDDLLIVPDTRLDDRFACNPLVQSEPGVRFYAGAPLLSHDGFNLGTLCLLDSQPRNPLSVEQQSALVDLAATIVHELELRLAAHQTAQSEDKYRTVITSMAENYARLKVGSFVSVPFQQYGRWLGFLAVTKVDPYKWRVDEIALLQEISSRIFPRIERARAEVALRAADARLRAMTDAVPILIWETDETGIIFLNRYYLDFFGVAFETVREMGWTQFIHPDDAAGYEAAWREGLDRGQPYTYDCRFRRADGEYRWLRNIGQPVGENRFVGCSLDITDSKRQEANLAFLAEIQDDLARLTTADAMMQTIGAKIGSYLNLSVCAFIDIDEAQDLAIVSYNWHRANVTDLVGTYRISEFVSEEFYIASRAGEIVVVSDTNTDARTDAENFAAFNIQAFIHVPLLHDGQWKFLFDVYDSEARDWREDEIELVRELANRIFPRLERARAETALRQSEERYRTLFESIDEGFCAIEMLFDENNQPFDYRFIEVNPAFEQQTGLVEAVGKTILEIAPTHESYWFEIYGNVAKTGEAIRFENYANALNRWFDVYAFRIGEAQSHRVAVLFTDITRRKQAENEREQLLQREQAARETAEQANRIKDEFLAVLSHELRSPLNPILGWTRLLQSGKLDRTRQREALSTIERNAKLQTQLIEDLLDISRIMQGKLSLTKAAVSLTYAIAAAVETVGLAAEAKQIQILLDLTTETALVLGDAARLQQVVWNLLINAVKFTPNGGRVTIELRQIDRLAQIRVIDTGIGIDPQFLPYVFEYFRQADSSTTRKFGGLGLGLAIVRQIVEMHGGTVRAESLGENQGATFTVQLPTLGNRESGVGSREDHKHSPLPTPHSPLTDLQILVVDDEADTREFQAFVLEESGARVIAVASGLEALQVLEQTIPDVLVSDVGMAQMDGYMLMRQIRSRPPQQGGKIPAIALTAYARDFDRQKSLQSGFQAHITKPVEPEALVKAIIKLLDPN